MAYSFCSQSLVHENIVEILGDSCDVRGSEVLIVMEYLEQGSLNHFLRHEGDHLTIKHFLIYARDIARVSISLGY